MTIQRLLPRPVSFILYMVILTTMAVACVALVCLPAMAEDVPEALRPPKGAPIAIVVF
jgi:hypothetical protein